MDNLIDFNKITGLMKPMHAVNNGPQHKDTGGQNRSNLKAFQDAGIPYVRTHDAAIDYGYGGEHVVDIYAVFPNFDCDPYDPQNYDFTITDEYLALIKRCGAETFYRLGSKIEHWVKKYNILPPKDFKKWAVICEHIIRHYNYGWADGFYYNLKFWEIWNEPDIDPEDREDRRCWGGTYDQFFDLFVTTFKHLKSCFPELMIGGPAVVCVNPEFEKRLFDRLKQENIKPDFFSWHVYFCNPSSFKIPVLEARRLLDEYDFTDTLNICDEWNYVKDWGEKFCDTVKTIVSMKGAAFTAAVMCVGMQTPLDMLMYYDARPCIFNGLFDYYTLDKIKGYYPFKMFNELYKLKNNVFTRIDEENIFAVSAANDGKYASLIVAFDDENDFEKDVTIEIVGYNGTMNVYTLDDKHDCVKTGLLDVNGKLNIHIKNYSVLLVTNIEL